jgi:predicted transcriptional regulator
MTNGVVQENVTSRKDLPVELQVLELFNQNRTIILGPTDVQKFLGISKGTVSPKLKALAEAGYLKNCGDGKYMLGSRVFELAVAYHLQAIRQLDQQVELVQSVSGVAKRMLMEVGVTLKQHTDCRAEDKGDD